MEQKLRRRVLPRQQSVEAVKVTGLLVFIVTFKGGTESDRRLWQGLPLRCGSSYAAASAPTSLEPPTLFECAQNPRLKQQTCCMACAQKTTMLPHTLSVL
ncbi:hypothetical protein FQA47_023650 [Oryzias melastigma]|uniref:Uncharacterized protein n=1 Tax=Oryzias melastigma TaxID=30732 RepID=A0A834FPX6_ORYME|nr:hypothetical protein FQA47_023650 [Oryzias melastigma]